MATHQRLYQSASPMTLAGWTLGALCYGALALWGVHDLPLVKWADRTLILSALGALPMPIVLLNTLTTPPHAITRRFLGQGGAAIFADASRAGWRLVAALLAAPIGFILAGVWLGLDQTSLLRGAAVLTCGVVGASITAMALLAAAMATIARGTQGAWRAMAGVGFGPPEIAPLLYAPALAFLGGLIPAALVTAMWNAAPQVLSGDRAWAVTAVVLIGGALSGRRRCAAVAPLAHRALLAVEQAHATPFRLAEEAPEPPTWLAAPDAGAQFLGRAWVRRYPASVFASVLLAVAAATAVDRHSSWLAVAALTSSAALYAGTRALGLLHAGPELAAAGTWLGGRKSGLVDAERDLGRRLMLPAITSLAVGWTSGDWLATVLGLAAGALVALALTHLANRRIGLWAGRLGMALALLLAAGLG